MNEQVMIIFYVRDQEKSRLFYEQLLGCDPRLHVHGMTEFQLSDGVVFGIMPEEGIMRILENKIPHPQKANGAPRSELYLYVDNPDDYYARLIATGGAGLSETRTRNWGDSVAYGSDPDGHTLAFAKKQQ